MNRICQVVLVCYVCVVVFVFVEFSEADQNKLYRHRRYLAFQNFSKFFIRLNTKANMVPWNQIFAQAVGFRLNWDDPPDSFHPYHHLSRRAVYSSIEIILDSYMLYNRLRLLTTKILPPRGSDPNMTILHNVEQAKLLLIIFRHGLSGFHCVRRAICEMDQVCEPNGIYLKILKMFLRRQSSETDKWHKYTNEDCQLSINTCPFSMLEISPYTDI